MRIETYVIQNKEDYKTLIKELKNQADDKQEDFTNSINEPLKYPACLNYYIESSENYKSYSQFPGEIHTYIYTYVYPDSFNLESGYIDEEG